MMKELLNVYQLNALVLTLRIFEENLRGADAWLQGKEEQGILYRRKLNLSDEQRRAAREKIHAILEQIADLARRLELQPVDEDPVKLIRGQLNISWANLIDVQSKKLERFGEVDPDLGKNLDPIIQRLAEMAIELASMLNH